MSEDDLPLPDQSRLTWDEMLRVPVHELVRYSRIPVRIHPDADALFDYLARYTANLIAACDISL